MIESKTRLARPLDRFVDCLWYSDGESRSHKKERLLPSGTVELIFKLREDRPIRIFHDANDRAGQCFGGTVLSGAHSHHFAIDTTQPSPTVGVHFRPAGAAPFLGIPASELMDRHAGLQELWGHQAADLREQLMAASSPSSMFCILEQALLNRFVEPPHDYPAIINAIEKFTSASTISVQDVSDSMGYRAKQFIRRFHDYVGLTPKLFCRIQRFQSALDQIAVGEGVEWVNVALDSGYYDQSHLIRDFRAFSGVTPSEYQPVEADRKNHMIVNS